MSAALQCTASGTLTYGLMNAWEKLPEGLAEPGVEADWYWTWVARRDDRIVAMLLGGAHHNAVFFSRIKASPEAGIWWIRGMVRACATDCIQRGYDRFFTMVSNNRTDEKIRRFLTRGRVAQGVAFQGYCVAAALKEFA